MQNGVHYTLDLNTGLTQILSDGITTYLYGLGRIAQTGTTTEYYLGDALGSVRQLVDEAGTITLAKFYAPYGKVMYSAGTGHTDYGFTGETTDVNGLVYLRARYYAPGEGRFLSRDAWNGSVNRPLSLNRWMYVEGNPINYVDPTGNCREDDANCIAKANEIETEFPNVTIDMGFEFSCGFSLSFLHKPWETSELTDVQFGLRAIKDVVGIVGDPLPLFSSMFGNVTIARQSSRIGRSAGGDTNTWTSTIRIFDSAAGAMAIVTIHEFGHILYVRKPGGGNWGTDFLEATQGKCYLQISGSCGLGYQPDGTTTEAGKLDLDEDFADSFARTIAFFNPEIPVYGITSKPDSIDSKRFDFIIQVLFSYSQ